MSEGVSKDISVKCRESVSDLNLKLQVNVYVIIDNLCFFQIFLKLL